MKLITQKKIIMKQSKTSQNYTENQDNVKSNLNFREVKNTPFRLLKENGKIKIIMGNNLVSKKEFTEESEAIKYINSKPYELTIIASAVYIEEVNNIKNNLKK